jgi:hypothetical protein
VGGWHLIIMTTNLYRVNVMTFLFLGWCLHYNRISMKTDLIRGQLSDSLYIMRCFHSNVYLNCNIGCRESHLPHKHDNSLKIDGI